LDDAREFHHFYFSPSLFFQVVSIYKPFYFLAILLQNEKNAKWKKFQNKKISILHSYF